MKPVTREVLVERRQNTLRWSSLIGGVLVAVGAWTALQMIGLGAGLTAIDLDDASQSRGAGIGAGIWTVIVPLIAMFVGGYVTTRLGRLFDREHAALHGAVLWGISTLLGVMMLTWTVGAVLGGVMRTGHHAARMTDRGVVMDDLDRRTDRMTPDERQAAIEEAKDYAEAATDTAGKTLLGAGVALLLGLGASIGGAVLGVRRRDTGHVRPTTEQGVPGGPPPVDYGE
jgi:hypothetical protein